MAATSEPGPRSAGGGTSHWTWLEERAPGAGKIHLLRPSLLLGDRGVRCVSPLLLRAERMGTGHEGSGEREGEGVLQRG